jgi:NAD+ synthase (glutamine-hydrolysing)
MPNAPKVGSGGSLSPRGDWRAPSDSEALAWRRAVATIPDAEPAGATRRRAQRAKVSRGMKRGKAR